MKNRILAAFILVALLLAALTGGEPVAHEGLEATAAVIAEEQGCVFVCYDEGRWECIK